MVWYLILCQAHLFFYFLPVTHHLTLLAHKRRYSPMYFKKLVGGRPTESGIVAVIVGHEEDMYYKDSLHTNRATHHQGCALV